MDTDFSRRKTAVSPSSHGVKTPPHLYLTGPLDGLSNTNDQTRVVKCLESVDVHAVRLVPLQIRVSGAYAILSFDSVNGVQYGIEARSTLTGALTLAGNVTGTGQTLQGQILNDNATRFFRLVAPGGAVAARS